MTQAVELLVLVQRLRGEAARQGDSELAIDLRLACRHLRQYAAQWPSPFLARISSRSNSARPPSTVSISRPCGVVVSAQASPSDLNAAPVLPTASRILSKSLVLRASRSSRVTISTSPADYLGQLGPVGLHPTDLLRVDFYAPGGPELCILPGEALVVRAHPGIAVDWHNLLPLLKATYALKNHHEIEPNIFMQNL